MSGSDKATLGYAPFALKSGLFRFYWGQGTPVLSRLAWKEVLLAMAEHYDIYRQGKLRYDDKADERGFRLLEGDQLEFLNFYLLCKTMFTSWFSFQNTLRDVIELGVPAGDYNPYSMGRIILEKDVEPLPGINLFDYLSDKNFLEGMEEEKNWVYERSSLLPSHEAKRLKIIYHYFVDKSGKWVYFTCSAWLMSLSFFLSFLKELMLLISYYDRLGYRLDPFSKKNKSQVAIHEATCRDKIYYYSQFLEVMEKYATEEGRSMFLPDFWPAFKDVEGYFEELYLLTKEWGGDWSLVRPENYDFFEKMGGVYHLYQLFIEIFFGGFLRNLVQGQPQGVSPDQSLIFPMGEFQRKAFPKSQPHFKFLWDVNLSHSALDYYGAQKKSTYNLQKEYSSDMLLYNPQWISQELRQDLLHWMSMVNSDIGNTDSMMPIFGFSLTDEGKEEERIFAQILVNLGFGIRHGGEVTSHVGMSPFGQAMYLYGFYKVFHMFPDLITTIPDLVEKFHGKD